jgi:hypothetical protein
MFMNDEIDTSFLFRVYDGGWSFFMCLFVVAYIRYNVFILCMNCVAGAYLKLL